MKQLEDRTFRDLGPDEVAALRKSERESAARERSEDAPAQLVAWRRATPRLSAGAASLVLLALLLPTWLVDAIRVRQTRALELPASADPSLYDAIGSWGFGVRALLAWLGVGLAAVAWRASARRRATDYVAPPTVLVGAVVALLASWLFLAA